MSASGTVGTDPTGTPATQKLYELTPDENNNIFAVSTGKIPGATQNGAGGYGYGMGIASTGNSSFNKKNDTYTTVVSGYNMGDNNSIPFAIPNIGSLQTNNTASPTISISQNYLPLGITANVKDAYFNHNGII